MIIFDFDLTLVNTQPVQKLRTQRKWKEVMAQAGELEVYSGINELLKELVAGNQTLAIVTNSPDMIPHHFIRQYEWPIEIVLGYHQVSRKKPDPEGILLAMKMAGANPDNTFHVGDQPEDTQASRAANVTAIGAGWGLVDTQHLEMSAPDYFFASISELRNFLLEIV